MTVGFASIRQLYGLSKQSNYSKEAIAQIKQSNQPQKSMIEINHIYGYAADA
jgi:hypothetical protein